MRRAGTCPRVGVFPPLGSLALALALACLLPPAPPRLPSPWPARCPRLPLALARMPHPAPSRLGLLAPPGSPPLAGLLPSAPPLRWPGCSPRLPLARVGSRRDPPCLVHGMLLVGFFSQGRLIVSRAGTSSVRALPLLHADKLKEVNVGRFWLGCGNFCTQGRLTVGTILRKNTCCR